MAKVDILLPFWGDVDLLKKAVESVLSQTVDDWRLLVFDDCYDSEEPAKYFANLNDKRITYRRHEKNLGITRNFNFALQEAKSKYCVMFGCDDVMLPNYLELALKHIGSCDFYQPGVEVINAHGDPYLPLADRVKRILRPRKSGIYSGEKLAASLCRGNWLYFPSLMWKTSTIQKYQFDTQYKILEDVVLQMEIIKNGGILFLDKNVTFQYRRFSESLSSKEKSGVRFHEENSVYSKLALDFKNMGWAKASRAAKLHISSRLHQLVS